MSVVISGVTSSVPLYLIRHSQRYLMYGYAHLAYINFANMSGSEKLSLLTIGKVKKPRCFRGVMCLPTVYEANTSAWMTSAIFEEWLRKWDAKLTRHNRKIALFTDNCSAHPRVQGLQSIELIFPPPPPPPPPPNTTSGIQPCDQGIIQASKVHYRKNMVKRSTTVINSGSTAAYFKITLLDGLQMLRRAWESLTESTISNCFRKGGFILPLEPEVEEEDSFVDLDAETASQDDPMHQLEIGNLCSFDEYIAVALLLTMDSNVLPCQQIRTLYFLSCRSQKKTNRVTIQVIHYLQLLTSKLILLSTNCGHIS